METKENKIKVTKESLKDLSVNDIQVVPEYVYQDIMDCAQHIFEESAKVEDSVAFMSIHLPVFKTYWHYHYFTNLDLSELNDAEGRIMFYNWMRTHDVGDLINDKRFFEMCHDVGSIVCNMSEILEKKVNYKNSLAGKLIDALPDYFSEANSEAEAQRTEMIGNKLIDILDRYREIDKVVDEKPDIPAFSFAKKK